MHRLRELRMKTFRSQKTIAKDVNISVCTLCRYENRRKINNKTAIQFSKYFNVSVFYFLGRTEHDTNCKKLREKQIDTLLQEDQEKKLKALKLKRKAEKKWREENPEKFKQSVNNWYENNKERVRELNQNWREENREHYNETQNEYMKDYLKKNPDKKRQYRRTQYLNQKKKNQDIGVNSPD